RNVGHAKGAALGTRDLQQVSLAIADGSQIDAPGRGGLVAGDAPQNGRLSRPGLANDPQRLTSAYFEAHRPRGHNRPCRRTDLRGIPRPGTFQGLRSPGPVEPAEINTLQRPVGHHLFCSRRRYSHSIRATLTAAAPVSVAAQPARWSPRVRIAGYL